jgi:hypothetical protein
MVKIFMRRGCTSGWKDYEHRPTKLQLAASLDEWAEWNGARLDGKKILVCREQGFGDEIMFARYVKFLVGMGRRGRRLHIPRISSANCATSGR